MVLYCRKKMKKVHITNGYWIKFNKEGHSRYLQDELNIINALFRKYAEESIVKRFYIKDGYNNITMYLNECFYFKYLRDRWGLKVIWMIFYIFLMIKILLV